MAKVEQFVQTLAGNRCLFVDDYVVAQAEGMTKRLHQPVKHPGNPILTGEGAEGEYVVLHGSVLYDPADALYKIWYMADRGYRYAVSKDGLGWEKPDVDVFPDGGEPNNVVFRGAFEELYMDRRVVVQGISVMLHEEAEHPEERFKLFTFYAPSMGESEEFRTRCKCRYGYYTATSPDGINWKCNEESALSKERDDPLMSDCNTCNYDPQVKRFIAFTKRHVPRGDGIGDQDVMQRARGVSFSTDFVHWTKPVTCLHPDDHDPRDMNLYRQSGWVL